MRYIRSIFWQKKYGFRAVTVRLLCLCLLPFICHAVVPVFAESAGGYEAAMNDVRSAPQRTDYFIKAGVERVFDAIFMQALEEDIKEEAILEEEPDMSVTVLVYMNGSTLETGGDSLASHDIDQMLAAELSEQVTVLLETGGTARWAHEEISSQTTQRHRIEDGSLVLIDDTGIQQDMTDPETLKEFILFGAKEAPADRYILILWGHGRGPEIGFGLDDFQSVRNAMSINEMAGAIETAKKEAEISFTLIGFDTCLVGNIETVYALRNCCDYLAASEDYEPAYGWQYTYFLNVLSQNTAIEIPELSQAIVEGFIEECRLSGDRGMMAVIDMARAEELMQAWLALEAAEGANLDRIINRIWTDQSLISPVPTSPDGYISDDDLYSLQDYGLTDVEAICELSETEEALELSALLKEAIICVDTFHMARTMCGLAVCR